MPWITEVLPEGPELKHVSDSLPRCPSLVSEPWDLLKQETGKAMCLQYLKVPDPSEQKLWGWWTGAWVPVGLHSLYDLRQVTLSPCASVSSSVNERHGTEPPCTPYCTEWLSLHAKPSARSTITRCGTPYAVIPLWQVRAKQAGLPLKGFSYVFLPQILSEALLKC